jgi:hypothetical protein
MILVAYHYIKNDKSGLTSYGGELRPVDRILNREIRKKAYKEYADRARQMRISCYDDDKNDALAYFHWMYNKLYRPVLNTDYKNNGIYLTPVDLWPYIKYYTARVVVDLKKINAETTVIQVGKMVKKFSFEECNKLTLLYDKRRIEGCLKNSRRIFMNLPQIVCFEESIQFDPGQIEKLRRP